MIQGSVVVNMKLTRYGPLVSEVPIDNMWQGEIHHTSPYFTRISHMESPIQPPKRHKRHQTAKANQSQNGAGRGGFKLVVVRGRSSVDPLPGGIGAANGPASNDSWGDVLGGGMVDGGGGMSTLGWAPHAG